MRQRIQFCTARDGVRIAYATAGRGAPLLRVGGWLTHLERDWDSPVWRHWMQELAGDHVLARFDIRGSGLSDRSVPIMGLDTWVDDVETVADALGWERFPVLGLCQGGAMALAYAARHPDRVSRLVLCNSYARGAYAFAGPSEESRQADALGQLIEVGWGRSTPAFRDLFARLITPDAGQEQLDWWDELQRTTTSSANAARMWQEFHRIDVAALARQVRAPTLVCHVRGDSMVPFEQGRRLAGMIPGAVFLPLEGKNHVLQSSDRAWPEFVSALHDFLGDADKSETTDRRFAGLTHRERAVLDALAQGLSNAEIAQRLSITPKTVRNHVSRILGKLGVASRAQAIVCARDAGFGQS